MSERNNLRHREKDWLDSSEIGPERSWGKETNADTNAQRQSRMKLSHHEIFEMPVETCTMDSCQKDRGSEHCSFPEHLFEKSSI